MTNFIGNIKSKIDSKGRVNFPSAFTKQLAEDVDKKFVIKKDIFENCLVIYTMEEWERQVALIKKNTNPFNRQHAAFLRQFFKDTAEIKLDSHNRILIPASLLEVAKIKNDVQYLAHGETIELWASNEYEKTQMEAEDFADLAENVLGGDLLEL